MASRLLPGRVTAPSLMLVIRGAPPRGGAVYRTRPLGTSKLGTAGPGEAGEETEGAAQEGHLVGGKREEPRNSLLTLASVASQLLLAPLTTHRAECGGIQHHFLTPPQSHCEALCLLHRVKSRFKALHTQAAAGHCARPLHLHLYRNHLCQDHLLAGHAAGAGTQISNAKAQT